MRLLMLTVLCLAMPLSSATAQVGGRWLIVSTGSDAEAAQLDAAANRVHRALVANGAQVWAPAEAAKRFETEASTPPTKLSDAELERWMSLSRRAVDDLAEGEHQKARKKLNAAQKISRDSIEELNRDPERARRVFDTCLYSVRAVLATESESRARSVARECRRLVPRAAPSPYMHPPAVTELLDEIDALQAKQSGELRVESVPSGCPARLNGVLLGETPVTIGDVFPGKYRVQVECDPAERGRVHLVTVGAGSAARLVDTRFDAVLVSRPSLQLHYAKRTDVSKYEVADARRVAREVTADELVLLGVADGVMTLRRIDARDSGSNAFLAATRVAVADVGPSDTDLASVAAALVAGECTDFTPGTPAPLECGRAPAAASATASVARGRSEGRRPRGQFIAGMTLVGVGLAGLATGYALLIPRSSAGEDWIARVDADATSGAPQATDTSAQQRWFNLRGGIIASASVGSAALITAMPLALPNRDKTPWWAWVSGGVGLGLGAFSIAYGVTADPEPSASCSSATVDPSVPRACATRGDQTSVALLTGLTAMPLITMPLVYLLRRNPKKLEPEAHVARGFAYFGIRGKF